jgi:hypothetical protein
LQQRQSEAIHASSTNASRDEGAAFDSGDDGSDADEAAEDYATFGAALPQRSAPSSNTTKSPKVYLATTTADPVVSGGGVNTGTGTGTGIENVSPNRDVVDTKRDGPPRSRVMSDDYGADASAYTVSLAGHQSDSQPTEEDAQWLAISPHEPHALGTVPESVKPPLTVRAVRFGSRDAMASRSHSDGLIGCV